jgi:hypothetical protein
MIRSCILDIYNIRPQEHTPAQEHTQRRGRRTEDTQHTTHTKHTATQSFRLDLVAIREYLMNSGISRRHVKTFCKPRGACVGYRILVCGQSSCVRTLNAKDSARFTLKSALNWSFQTMLPAGSSHFKGTMLQLCPFLVKLCPTIGKLCSEIFNYARTPDYAGIICRHNPKKVLYVNYAVILPA